MNYEKEIERILQEFGGSKSLTRKAEKAAEDWWDDAKKGSKTSKNIQSTKKLQTGKLYKLEYSPISEHIQFWDSEPLVVCLDINTSSKTFCGLNFHYLPSKIDIKAMSLIRDLLNSRIELSTRRLPYSAEAQTPISIPSELFSVLKTLKYDFGIRNYSFSRIKQCDVICFEDWGKALFLPSKFKNIAESQVYLNFLKYAK